MTNLLDIAREAYNAAHDAPNPYLAWSPASMAFRLGIWMHATGRSIPRSCKMSRGYTMRCNDMLIKFHDDGKLERIA